MDEGLVAARALPDGSFEVTDQRDAIDRLRNGDATLGWSGDPNLGLVLNTVEQRWEVWYHCADGVDRLAMHRPHEPGQGLPIVSLIRAIVKHDTRHIDVVGEAEAANVKLAADRQARFRERTGDAGDRLAFALGRDLDMPAQDGRVYPLHGPRR